MCHDDESKFGLYFHPIFGYVGGRQSPTYLIPMYLHFVHLLILNIRENGLHAKRIEVEGQYHHTRLIQVFS